VASTNLHIVKLELKNFRAFKRAVLDDIPRLCVLVGANGTGKSTVFQVFNFLKDAMTSNVTTALARLGGGRGFQEVRTRGSDGEHIELVLQFRADINKKSRLVTYELAINEEDGEVIVEKEVLKYRRGSKGLPWKFLDFKRGEGSAVTNELETDVSEEDLQREEQSLKSKDLLAIKALSQFERFPAALALGELIEDWHISDFHISRARGEQQVEHAEHLSREGENLANVIEFLYKRHRRVFDQIIAAMRQRVPGVTSIDAKVTDEGRVLLRFSDGAFGDPFLARHVSDGTIKMLAYLTLLYDPKPHPLLCVEEPENQLYPRLLAELAEEFRTYTQRGGQVFVSTHSPDFLNAIQLDEVFWLVKSKGCTEIRRARDNPQLVAYIEAGEQLGALWKQGHFPGVDPQ
jgi:predicted ATPase